MYILERHKEHVDITSEFYQNIWESQLKAIILYGKRHMEEDEWTILILNVI